MDDLIAAVMPETAKALFPVGAIVLVNEISPSTEFIVAASVFDRSRNMTAYHLTPGSGVSGICVVATESDVAIASAKVKLDTRGVDTTADQQDNKGRRELGRMIDIKDIEAGDTVEANLACRLGFTGVTVVEKDAKPPYFEYLGLFGAIEKFSDQIVRLLSKSTGAIRAMCKSGIRIYPAYRDRNPNYEELRFGMLGLLHGRQNSSRLSRHLTRKLQELGILKEVERGSCAAEAVLDPRPKPPKNTDISPAMRLELAAQRKSNKIGIGDFVQVTTLQGRIYKGKVARKILLSGPKPSERNPLGVGDRGPGFKVVGMPCGERQHWIEDRVKLLKKATAQGKLDMHLRFPKCEIEDFDIDEFEAQIAATDAREAAADEAYTIQKNAQMKREEAAQEAHLREMEQEADENAIQEELWKTEPDPNNFDGNDGEDTELAPAETAASVLLEEGVSITDAELETTPNIDTSVFSSGTATDAVGTFHIGDRVKPRELGAGRKRIGLTSYRWEKGTIISILFAAGPPTRLGVKKGYRENIVFCLPDELEKLPERDQEDAAAAAGKEFKFGDAVMVVDARFLGVWKGTISKVHEQQIGAAADAGRTFDIAPDSDVQTLAGIKIRGELLGVSAADMQLMKSSVLQEKRAKNSDSKKTTPRW